MHKAIGAANRLPCHFFLFRRWGGAIATHRAQRRHLKSCMQLIALRTPCKLQSLERTTCMRSAACPPPLSQCGLGRKTSCLGTCARAAHAAHAWGARACQVAVMSKDALSPMSIGLVRCLMP